MSDNLACGGAGLPRSLTGGSASASGAGFAMRMSVGMFLGVLAVAPAANAFDLLGTIKGAVTQNAGGIAGEVVTQAIASPDAAARDGEKAGDEPLPANEKLEAAAVNPEDLASYSGTVVVPTAYVKLLVEGRASAVRQGGYRVGYSSNSVKASARYKVVGIDKKLAQDIAQRAYDDFVSRLRAAGYTVLTYGDIRDRDFVKNAEREKADSTWGMPVETSRASDETYVVAAPSDEQMFASGLNGGVFNQFISLGKPKFKDAVVIIPQYMIAAPRVWGVAESSYSTISAAVKTAPDMQLKAASAYWMGAPVVRIMHGVPGVTMKAAVRVSAKVGDLVKAAEEPSAASTTANVLTAGLQGLSRAMGVGTITQDSAEYTFTIDRDAYVSGALKGADDFNARVEEVAVAAKK